MDRVTRLHVAVGMAFALGLVIVVTRPVQSQDLTTILSNFLVDLRAGTPGVSSTLDYTAGTYIKIGTNPATTGAVRLANNTFLYSRNAANGADHQLLGENGSNQVILGTDGLNVLPPADNTSAFGSSSARWTNVVAATHSGATWQSGGGTLMFSTTAPTISSGFGTSPSVSANNGTLAFRVNVGTGGTASSGVIGLPTASTGWNCSCTDITTNSATVFVCKQTASATTTATVGNFNTSAAAAAWVASDILAVSCTAY